MQNFKVAVYFPEFDIQVLDNGFPMSLFEERFDRLVKTLKIDHLYIETHRSGHLVEKEKIERLAHFFRQYDILLSGGITFTDGNFEDFFDGELFDTFCYSKPDAEEKIRKIVRYSASLFDELVIDDFFFTHCKCPDCIKAKGSRSWKDFRLETMKKVGTHWVMEEAKKTNPNVKVILKYPNWYDHYQDSGYNVELGALFDGTYAGTETRDAIHTQQNLPRYSSYFVMQYIDHIHKGKLGGGWFDGYDCLGHLNSFVEQATLTLLGGAKEVCFFNLGDLVTEHAIAAPLLQFAYDRLDPFVPLFKSPLGIATYKPFHSCGDDFLENYLGMVGIPFIPEVNYPAEAKTVFLSAHAAYDQDLLSKMQKGLEQGQTLFVTRGLADALMDKGFNELMLYEPTCDKALVDHFGAEWEFCAYRNYAQSAKKILLTRLGFKTNDSQNLVSGLSGATNYPIILKSKYSNGEIYLLNIPDNVGQLYDLPTLVLSTLRNHLLKDLPYRVQGQGQYMFFPYAEDHFVLYSQSGHVEDYTLISQTPFKEIIDLESQQSVASTNGKECKLHLLASTYKLFKIVR